MTVDTTNFEGLKKFRLGDVTSLNYGRALVSHNRIPGDVPVYSSAGATGWHNTPLVNSKGIVVGRKGNVGSVFLVEEPFYCIDTAYYIKPEDTTIDFTFLYYLLKSINLTTLNEDSAVPGLNRNTALSVPIYIPEDISEQKRIGEILYAFDAKIKLNRKMNATLEKMAQAIFKEWFVDFNFPGATDEFVDSALGPIPIGWEAKPLDKVAHFLNGLALQKYPPKNEADELPVIKIKQLRANSIDGADISSKSIPKEYHVSFADLLFSWSGSLEVSFWTGPNGALNQHLFKVTSKEYPLWFCYHWLLHYLPAFRSIAEGKATTMGHIKRENLSNKYCAIPPNIEKLGKHLEAIHRKILANSKEANYLEKTKETLLGYFFELRNNDGI